MKNLLFILALLSFTSIYADDGLITINGSDNEVEAGITAPGATRSIPLTLLNSNSSDNADNLSIAFSSSEFDFLGGSYPGIGGDCGSSLASGASCIVMVEHSPVSSGDSDDLVNLSYDLPTTSLGSSHSVDFIFDGHSDAVIVSGCSALTPSISSVTPNQLTVSSTSTVFVSGHNFSVATTVNVPGLNISNVNIIDVQNLSFSVEATASVADYDLEIQNECGNLVQTDAISVIASTWIDLRTAAGVTTANPNYTTAGISGYTVDPSFGLQITNTSTGWNKMLRFDGVCAAPGSDFDIVIYRSGTAVSFMPALWNASTSVNPYPNNTTYYTQYIGFWIPGASSSQVWGSQGGEGGSNWNQNFTAINLPVGNFYRFAFRGGAQNGQTVEVFQVDANLNDISSLGSFVSNKPNTPAASICPGLTPNTAGAADYFVTAVRAL